MNQTVLICSAGRRNQLFDCFRSDVERLGIGLRVLATDINVICAMKIRRFD